MTRGRYRWALAVVAVSAFMITMDNTVVNVALPVIRDDLGMTTASAQWVATGYILMFSCLMIAGGRIADVYGCRVAFISGMVIFTGASLAAGLAQNDAMLIVARVVQGAGAALAMPATLVIATVGRSDKQKSLGTIVWIAASAIAIAMGPFLGGFIAANWHWGWIFLINVVPGVLVIALALVVVKGRPDDAGAQVDMPGLLTSATALFAFIYGLELIHRVGWQDPAVLGVFGLAAIAVLSFVIVERWAPDPMVSLEFFQNRVFTGGLVSQMLWGIGFNGVLFYASFFLQDVLGFEPTKTGLVFLPSAMVVMVMTPVSFWLAARIGPRITIGGGMCLLAFGMSTFALLRPGDGLPQLMPGVLILSAGSAMAMPLAMYVIKAVPEERAGVASGILNVIREMSGAFGIAILGAVITSLEKSSLAAGTDKVEAFRHAAAIGLLVGAGLVVIGGVVNAITLPPRERAERAERAEPKKTRITAPIPVLAAAGAPVTPLPLRGASGRWQGESRRTAAGRWVRDALADAETEHVRRAGRQLWPPPPPEGWYDPYVPAESPSPPDGVPELGGTATGPGRYRHDPW